LIFRENLDGESISGTHRDQIFCLELAQRLADGRLADAELLGEFVRAQPGARNQNVVQDRLAQNRISRFGGRAALGKAVDEFAKPVHGTPSLTSSASVRKPSVHVPRSIALLILRLWAPAVGHHIDFPPAPPATITTRSFGSLMIG